MAAPRRRTLIEILDDHERSIKRLAQTVARTGGGGTLSDLTDTTITSIASGELLKWNGSAWINNTPAEAGISATGHSHTESDISDLGSYLPLTGGTLTGNLTAGANTITAARYYINGDADTFIEQGAGGADTMTLVAGGSIMIEIDQDDAAIYFNASSHLVFNEAWADDGSAADPSYTFASDTTTGFYRAGGSIVALTLGGTHKVQMQWNQFRVDNSMHFVDVSPATVGGSADVRFLSVTGGYRLDRITSARKYKKDIDYDTDYLADVTLRPTYFTRKGLPELGFIADDLADEFWLLGSYRDGVIENYQDRAVMAVMAAKINRIESQIEEMKVAINNPRTPQGGRAE